MQIVFSVFLGQTAQNVSRECTLKLECVQVVLSLMLNVSCVWLSINALNVLLTSITRNMEFVDNVGTSTSVVRHAIKVQKR